MTGEGQPMLSIHPVDPAEAALAFGGLAEKDDLTPAEWASYCHRKGLIVFAAERDGELVGFAVAESCPHRIHVRRLEGDTHTCRRLLGRLVRAAGERDLSGWVPTDRPDLRRMFRRLGFIRGGRGHPEGRPASFYYWDRNSGD
jgi:hypothetical protein